MARSSTILQGTGQVLETEIVLADVSYFISEPPGDGTITIIKGAIPNDGEYTLKLQSGSQYSVIISGTGEQRYVRIY